MVHIILLILKAAGILLLSVLGLLLLLLCAVLFVPVTYRAEAGKDASVRVQAAVGWMFRMITLRFSMEGEKPDLTLRIFGIPVLRPLEKKKEKKKRRPARRSKKKAEKADRPPEKPSAAEETEKARPPQSQEKLSEPDKGEPAYAGPAQKPGAWEKLVRTIRGLCDKIKHMWEAWLRIPRAVRSALDQKDRLLEFWNREEHCRARTALWKELLYLLKKIRPRKLRGYLHFGFADPSSTGMCLGAVSMFYAWYPEHLELVPDFDGQVLEGNLSFRGKLRLYVLAVIALRVLLNRDVRLMYQHWKEL